MRTVFWAQAAASVYTVSAAVRQVEWNITYVDNVSPDGSDVARRVIG